MKEVILLWLSYYTPLHMLTDNPSPQIIMQRVRNLILEYVKTVAGYKMGDMPGLMEVFCMWEDFVAHPLEFYFQQFEEPVYTLSEKMSLKEVDEAWKMWGDTVTDEMLYENELDVLATPEWMAFSAAAARAMAIMAKRGKLPEDHAIS
ncbi:hypothetical protein [Hymenobacter roseosalivarius]|uniref:hypothetical protein n=1 Tax=Hymenobacter roseosalivarius TaxID=89967 RepID=UPI001179F01C|nr:hypothetical protein [Hymenobacter roseosalivarius]